MASKAKLPVELQRLVGDMAISDLEVFSEIARSPNYPQFKAVIKALINIDKERSFIIDESDPSKLAKAHALARGKVAAYLNIVSIIELANKYLHDRVKKDD